MLQGYQLDLILMEKGEGEVVMLLLSVKRELILQSWWLEFNLGVMVYWLLIAFPTQLMLLVSRILSLLNFC